MKLLSPKEVAAVLGISSRSLARIDDELLPKINIRRSVRYDSQDLENFINQSKTFVIPTTQPNEELDKEPKQSVYFVRATQRDLIKIGYTRNVSRRFKQLEFGMLEPINLLFSIPGGKDVEEIVHDIFESFRFKGEWFRICESWLAPLRGIKHWRRLTKDEKQYILLRINNAISLTETAA